MQNTAAVFFSLHVKHLNSSLRRARGQVHTRPLLLPSILVPVPASLQDALFELLKKDFDATYAGNRAPFPLFVHAPWFTFVSTHCMGAGPEGRR